jgi:putative membrane protein
MHWNGDFGMGGYGMGGFGWIFMIIFWALLILCIIYLVKNLAGGAAAPGKKTETAEEILKKRFARGEVSKEEFEEAMRVLKQHD